MVAATYMLPSMSGQQSTSDSIQRTDGAGCRLGLGISISGRLHIETTTGT